MKNTCIDIICRIVKETGYDYEYVSSRFDHALKNGVKPIDFFDSIVDERCLEESAIDISTCPMCGGETDILDEDLDKYPFGFGCTKCYCAAYGYTLKDTIDIWKSMIERCKEYKNG